MKFGIHNPSWVYGADPAVAFEGVKVKPQWAENHGFTWFIAAGGEGVTVSLDCLRHRHGILLRYILINISKATE